MTVVCLEGEHDLSTLPSLTVTLTSAISSDDAEVVVDLSAVTFLSAATIDELIRSRNILQVQSRTLTLRSPTKFARRILGLCGLAELVELRAADRVAVPAC